MNIAFSIPYISSRKDKFWDLSIIRKIYGLSIALCLVLFIFYIISINGLTEDYFVIKNYNQELEKLAQENKSLQISFAQENFLGKLESRAQELNFEKTKEIKYIQITENSLAVK